MTTHDQPNAFSRNPAKDTLIATLSAIIATIVCETNILQVISNV